MKNREERRAYWRKIKNDKRTSICPKCGYESLFYSVSVPVSNFNLEEWKQDVKYETAIKCEICDAIIYQGEDVTKLVPPGIILPLPLDIFDYALRHPELGEEENVDS